MELRPGIEKLLAPSSPQGFLDHYLACRPFVLHGSPARLPELLQLPALQSAADVLRACHGASVMAMMLDRKDESNSVLVSPDVALKLYGSGMNLSVPSAERFIPELEPWLQGLKLDLGMPRRTWGRSIVYMSPSHSGAPAHFDVNVNFSLQLQGRKRWVLAENDSVAYPTERHVMGLDEPSATLRAQAHAPLPNAMPSTAQVVDLVPGSLLFVPHGYWHTTTSDEPTLSVNFTFTQRSWASQLAHALRDRLHTRPAWRKAPVMPSDGAAAENLMEEAEALCDDLRRIVADLNPRDLVRAASPFAHAYRKASGARLRRGSGGHFFEAPGQAPVAVDAPEEYLPIFDFIFERDTWFRSEDVLATSKVVSHMDILSLLQRLEKAQLIECRDD